MECLIVFMHVASRLFDWLGCCPCRSSQESSYRRGTVVRRHASGVKPSNSEYKLTYGRQTNIDDHIVLADHFAATIASNNALHINEYTDMLTSRPSHQASSNRIEFSIYKQGGHTCISSRNILAYTYIILGYVMDLGWGRVNERTKYHISNQASDQAQLQACIPVAYRAQQLSCNVAKYSTPKVAQTYETSENTFLVSHAGGRSSSQCLHATRAVLASQTSLFISRRDC
eukprot:1065323-Pleurochrysis_carterae.AAC.4